MTYSEDPEDFNNIQFEKKGCLLIVIAVVVFWIYIIIQAI